MANEEQLAILRQGVDVWNKWRTRNTRADLDLSGANLASGNLKGANFRGINLSSANLDGANLREVNLIAANLKNASLRYADLSYANLYFTTLRQSDFFRAKLLKTNLTSALFYGANLKNAILKEADLSDAVLFEADLTGADIRHSNFTFATFGLTNIIDVDLQTAKGLDKANQRSPSSISLGTFALSKGTIPEIFLRGCGVSDWEIEQSKLYNPALSNDEISQIQYRIYELRATQALQISPLFISYSHADNAFVDKIGDYLNRQGVRYWRDIHNTVAGPLEAQVDRAIRQNPTVLIVFSENSISSDWVQHEVRKAREFTKELGRHVLCPIALDNSWKNSPWPERLMEQVQEYNILDFSKWQDDKIFEKQFRKLIEGLNLFYKA